MAVGAPARRRDHVHQALFYGSDDELLKVVVPFLEEGLAASEPALVALNNRATDLLRAHVDHPELVFHAGRDRHRDPASTIRHDREVIAAHLAGGARRVRVVGEVPHPGHGSPWDWWARYEATVNHAYAEFPLRHMCPYDLRITPGPVVEDVTRTHPWLVSDGGSHVANPRYEDPRQFLLERPPAGAHPVETACDPRFDLLDPTAADARRAVRACGGMLATGTVDLEDVVMCVSEAITNALVHGRPPVRLRIWSTADHLVAAVSDRGVGPGDPFVGLLPSASPGSAGLGLWMAHQLCSHLTFDRTEDGFTVRLVFDAHPAGR